MKHPVDCAARSEIEEWITSEHASQKTNHGYTDGAKNRSQQTPKNSINRESICIIGRVVTCYCVLPLLTSHPLFEKMEIRSKCAYKPNHTNLVCKSEQFKP